MFRNNIHTLSQSNTETIGNNSNLETLESINNKIIFAIVTGKIQDIRRLINSSNVNRIVDTINNYTALHYAVGLPNEDIVNYLMDCGADSSIKQHDNKDAIDLSIASNKRFLINYLMNKKTNTIDDLNYKVKNLEKDNKNLKETNEFLNKSTDEYNKKIDKITNELEVVKEENKNLKRKLNDSETSFNNLLKKNRKN